jgi:hypothetical protein
MFRVWGVEFMIYVLGFMLQELGKGKTGEVRGGWPSSTLFYQTGYALGVDTGRGRLSSSGAVYLVRPGSFFTLKLTDLFRTHRTST